MQPLGGPISSQALADAGGIGSAGFAICAVAYIGLRLWFYNWLWAIGCSPPPRRFISLLCFLGPTSRCSENRGDPSIRIRGRVVEVASAVILVLAFTLAVVFWA